MIIYSITYALDDSVEKEWLNFMKLEFLPAMLDSGYFEDYTFSRIMPQEGVDTAYNIQYQCFNNEKLELFINKEQSNVDALLINKFSGKFASFSTKLEVIQ